MIKEEHRRTTALVLANVGWWGAFGWAAVLTYINITTPVSAAPSTVQRVSGLFIILLMGVGIAAGSALSRMRLSETIVRAFEEGYNAFNNDRKPQFREDSTNDQ